MVDTHRTSKVQSLREARERRGEAIRRQEQSFAAHAVAAVPKRIPISQVVWKPHHLRRASAKMATAAARYGLQRSMMGGTASSSSDNLDRFANPEIPAREFIALADAILGVKLRDAEAAAFIACLSYEAGDAGGKPTGEG